MSEVFSVQCIAAKGILVMQRAAAADNNTMIRRRMGMDDICEKGYDMVTGCAGPGQQKKKKN